MTTKICRMSIPKGRRIVAISDIHAHLQQLVDLLEKIHFGAGDELFMIGDFLAKGPENLAALRYLMALDQQDNVHVMMGNLEYWHLSLIADNTPETQARLRKQMQEHLAWYGHSLYTDMLEEAGTPFHPEMDMAQAIDTIQAHFAPELDFLRALPVIIETDHLIFVHGGIPHEDLAQFAGEDPHQYMKFPSFLTSGLHFSKYVIVGHWPVRNYSDATCHNPIVDTAHRIISIDGGCGVETSGQVNAFIIEDEEAMQYATAYEDGFPVRIAAESQGESEDYLNIRYGDHAVEILETQGEKAYVRHISTGKCMWAPNDSIWHEGQQPYCIYSNYRMPIQKGEPLSVADQTDAGYLVKRNGHYGWYTGKLK